MATENVQLTTKVTPYQGKYRQELDDDEPATPNADPDTANPAADPELKPEEKTYKGRYDALKTHYDRRIDEFNAKIADLQRQIAAKPRHIPQTEAELEAFKTDYPDVFKNIRTIAAKEAVEAQQALDVKLEQLQVESRRAKRDRAEASLLRLHPDFEDLKASKEFHAWVGEQPEQIKSWLYDNEDDPLLAARAIDLYKSDTGIRNTTKKADSKKSARDASLMVDKTERGTDVDAQGKKIWKSSEITKLSRTRGGYERYEDEIDAAIREGRFIVDD